MSGERSRPNWVAQKKHEAIDYWDREAQARIKEGKYLRGFGNWTMKQLAKAHAESWGGLALDVASLGTGGLMVKGAQATARAVIGAKVIQGAESLRSIHKAATLVETTAPKWIDPLAVGGTQIVTPRRGIKAVSLITRDVRTEMGMGKAEIISPPQTRYQGAVQTSNPLTKRPLVREGGSFVSAPAAAPPMTPHGRMLVQPPETPMHLVQHGENLSKVAAQYQVPVKDFIDANRELLQRNGTRLRGADYLRIGDQLQLPNSATARLRQRAVAPDATYSIVDMKRLARPVVPTHTQDLSVQFNRVLTQYHSRPVQPMTAQQGRQFNQWVNTTFGWGHR